MIESGISSSQVTFARYRGIQATAAYVAVIAASCLWLSRIHAQTQPLTAEQVLASADAHFPSVLESLAERRGADAALLEANGEFDLVFAAEGFTRTAGYWDGSIARGGVRQNLQTLGSSVYLDYRISDGYFPIYEDINYTNDRGELKIGVLFSLLRDREYDARRFGLSDARLALQQADLEVLLTRIGVQQQALIAYWRWVIAGFELAVYEELLQIALDREAGLEEQVRRGARAEVFLVENQLNITNRRRLATDARRIFLAATNGLAFYYRDAEGRSQLPQRAELPPPPVIGETEFQTKFSTMPVSEALARRPELAMLRKAIDRARNRVALAENTLKPRVDFNVELAHDMGNVAEGGLSRDSTDAIIGLSFSVPLQQRTARGRIYRERAEVDALEQRAQLQQDRIALEVQNIILELRVADELLELAEQEVAQSDAMRDAEQRRFANGASDFFLVNIREETAASARIRYYEAGLARRIAQANYDAATVNLERLGIDDPVQPR